MTKYASGVLGAFGVVLLGSVAAGQARSLRAPGIAPDFTAEAQRYLQDRAERGPFSVAILVQSAGTVLLRTAHGMADFELGIPLTPDHIFRIGSLTKPFTATAVLRLRDEGRLSLSRSIVTSCAFALQSGAQ